MASIKVSHPRGGEIALHPGGEGEIRRALHRLVKKVTEDIEKRRYNTAIASMMEFTNLVEGKPSSHPRGGEIALHPGGEGVHGFLNADSLKTFILLLAPFAPHMSEELWQRTKSSVLSSPPAGAWSASDWRTGQFSDKGSSVVSLSETENRKTGKLNSDNRQQKTDNWSVHLQPWPSYDSSAISQDTVTIIVQVNGRVRDTLSVVSSQSSDKKAIEEEAGKSAKVAKFLEDKTVKKTIFIPGKLINFVVV